MERAAWRRDNDVPGIAEDNPLDALVGYNLKRSYMLFRSTFLSVQQDTPIPPRVFSALAIVVAQPGVTQSNLARTLGIERSGLVAIIDELQRSGWLERAPVPGDRRVQALFPTPAGKAKFTETRSALEHNETEILSVLTPSETKSLLALLQKLRAAHAGEE